jgi:hypothetical protein
MVIIEPGSKFARVESIQNQLFGQFIWSFLMRDSHAVFDKRMNIKSLLINLDQLAATVAAGMLLNRQSRSSREWRGSREYPRHRTRRSDRGLGRVASRVMSEPTARSRDPVRQQSADKPTLHASSRLKNESCYVESGVAINSAARRFVTAP